MKPGRWEDRDHDGAALSTRRVATVPNLLSALRILFIPAFVGLLLREDTRVAGFLLLGLVVSTDWVDGYLARRTGQVSELGKVLDPLADRLALAAALLTFVVLEAVPLWAALLIVVRDAVVLAVGAVLSFTGGPRIEVSRMGKYATFTLMWAIPLVAWGNLGIFPADAFRVIGWTWFVVGTFEYYVATVGYAIELRRVSRRAR
ncbi:MAG: CDP-alcohol phosphatidyltransferase family protein [Actinomycetota bacterium]